MRVLVIGAGIIGSIYGWALAESGHHIVHLVRSGRATAFRDGLPLDTNAVATLMVQRGLEVIVVSWLS
jgi:ketopantoate reductase